MGYRASACGRLTKRMPAQPVRPVLEDSVSHCRFCCFSQVFSEDDDDELDTTAPQHAAGKDVQGIPWDRLHFSREQYRVRSSNLWRMCLIPVCAAKSGSAAGQSTVHAASAWLETDCAPACIVFLLSTRKAMLGLKRIHSLHRTYGQTAESVVLLPTQDTRLHSYNNYLNLEEQCKAGMRKLDNMWSVCGRPAKVLLACPWTCRC